MPIEYQKSIMIEKVINSQWIFKYFPEETANKGYEAPGFNDSKWPDVSLPHTWNTYETTGELSPLKINDEGDNTYWWKGWGWYRKHFSINKDYSDRKVFIEFKGVQKYCKVWINGKYMGDHNGDHGSFGFDITDYIKPGEDNVLAVAVNNRQDDYLKSHSTIGEASFLYSGIYGDVTLVLKNKLYIPMKDLTNNVRDIIVTTPQVSKKEGVLRVQTCVKNDNPHKRNCTLQTSIIDAAGEIIQVIKSDAVINPLQLYKFDQTGKPVKKPHLWTKEDPYTYKVNIEVIDGKEVVDAYTSSSGLRFYFAGDTIKAPSAVQVSNNMGDIFIENLNKSSIITKENRKGVEPAKIMLTVSQHKIVADRGSVAVISANIVDLQGNPVSEVRNTIKWKVTGPATLIGPSVYESEINMHHELEGFRYMNLPVSNIVRSTGIPGRITVSVFASGMASVSIAIDAEETKSDNSVIIEPLTSEEGRSQTGRKILLANRLDDEPLEIELINEDFNLGHLDKPGFARVIRNYVIENNPSIDSTSVEFKTIIDLFASHLINNNGCLSANDFNYNAEHYNNCRLISRYINATKLPPLFKEGLKKYYADAIIRLGSEKNAGDEMNWLNWIPSGGTVVFSQKSDLPAGTKGVIVTNKSELTDLIGVVYPVFTNFSDEAKERALIFISKMNPYIIVTSGEKGNIENRNGITYKAKKGQPILIPLLKFIAE